MSIIKLQNYKKSKKIYGHKYSGKLKTAIKILEINQDILVPDVLDSKNLIMVHVFCILEEISYNKLF
jgi:hypothetical protein